MKKNLKKDQPMFFKGEIKDDDGDEKEGVEVFEATDIDNPPQKECKKYKKDASCWRALMPLPQKEDANKKD